MSSEPLLALTRLRRLAPWALICALACLPPRSASAQEQDAHYKELVDQALGEFKHKNWPEARVLFRRAHEISPSARTLRGMGVVSYEMRDYVQAVRDLTAALADPRQPLTDQQRSECETLLARSRTFVGVFALRVQPEQAALSLDGSRLAREPDGSVVLAFGEHLLRATAEGYEDASAHLTVQGGERGEVELTLAPLSRATAAAPLPGEPGRDRAQLPAPSSAPHAQGERSVRTGGLRYTWVALGAAAVFGGGAAASWYSGEAKLSDLDRACERRAALDRPCVRGSVNTDTVRRYERLTNAALGLSAAALVTAALVAYFEWPRERQVSVAVSPTSLSVRGAF